MGNLKSKCIHKVCGCSKGYAWIVINNVKDFEEFEKTYQD